LGENPIPTQDQKYIDGWKRLCPDYEFKLWNEKNYDVTKNEYMYQAYLHKKWGFVPDYLRLDIIYQYGGIYLDTDVELVKPFDELLDNEGFAGFEKGYDNNINLALGLGLGSVPHNRIIKAMLDDYSDRKFLRDDGTLDLTPSPQIQTQVLIKHGLELADCKQNIDSFTVYPSEYFCPMNYYTGEIELTLNTVSIHHYHASWVIEVDKVRDEIRKKLIPKLGFSIAHPISVLAAHIRVYKLKALGIMWRKMWRRK
jgi:Mannosyltransferase OCH1 and related enzymes